MTNVRKYIHGTLYNKKPTKPPQYFPIPFSVTESRDTLVERYNRAAYATKFLTETYQICLSTLVTLHNSYLRSKEVKNVLNRYALLRDMIKEAVRTESSWYSMIEIPKQNRAEPVQDYILRVCTVIESLRVPLAAKDFKETQKEKEERIEKVNGAYGSNMPALCDEASGLDCGLADFV